MKTIIMSHYFGLLSKYGIVDSFGNFGSRYLKVVSVLSTLFEVLLIILAPILALLSIPVVAVFLNRLLDVNVVASDSSQQPLVYGLKKCHWSKDLFLFLIRPSVKVLNYIGFDIPTKFTEKLELWDTSAIPTYCNCEGVGRIELNGFEHALKERVDLTRIVLKNLGLKRIFIRYFSEESVGGNTPNCKSIKNCTSIKLLTFYAYK